MIGRLENPLDRRERMAHVKRYLEALGLERYRAIVFGSVARGDYVAESDTDLLIVSDELPDAPMGRLDKLYSIQHIAPEIEPVGWREGDWRRRKQAGDPFIGILEKEGIEVGCGGEG